MTDMQTVKINDRWPIKLPKHRADRPEWYTVQGWERARLDAMHDVIMGMVAEDGRCVVHYVGAEEGDMAGLCAMWGAKMVLYEPNEKVWPNIKAIWESNGFSEPLSYPGFAANQTTHKQFFIGFPPAADGPVIGDHGFKELHADDPNIPKIKIDDIDGAVVDVISLDVEGAEWEVLRGAEQTLREQRPTIFLSLHPEFLFRIYGEYSGDLRRWIKDLGYKESLLAYDHEVHLQYEPL